MSYYIILYSSVFVFLSEKTVLLYDSISAKHLKYSDSNTLAIFNSRVHKGINVFKVNKHDHSLSLFDDITNNNMGWIASNTKSIPFQMAPIVGINTTNYSEEGSPQSKTLTDMSWDITKLNIYLDGNVRNLSDSFHPIKQAVFCDSNLEVNDRINAQLLMEKLQGIEKLIYLQEVNIICNQPNRYPEYNRFLYFLCTSLRKQIKLYLVVDLSYLISNVYQYEKLLLTHDNIFIKAIINSQKNDALHANVTILGNRCRYIKMVYSENDLDDNEHCQYIPIFNGNNIDFFEKNVFIDEDDLYDQSLSMQDIFRRKTMNEFYFGNTTIMFDGNVYNNIFLKSIGNINSCYNLIQLLSNNDKNNSWFLTRDKITPCNKCIYRYLCPPISNYEFAINRFNLCNYDLQ